jgi:hypothetical protein
VKDSLLSREFLKNVMVQIIHIIIFAGQNDAVEGIGILLRFGEPGRPVMANRVSINGENT